MMVATVYDSKLHQADFSYCITILFLIKCAKDYSIRHCRIIRFLIIRQTKKVRFGTKYRSGLY